MKDLPKYKITIDPEYSEDDQELGISMIAFTSRPAIMTKGMAFSSEAKPLYFSDDLKYRICAPVMIPMEIYRNDVEEYYVQFTEEEIDTIFNKFMRNLNNKNIFNLEHNAEDVVPAYVLEAWIVNDPKNDKAYSTFGIEVPKGTLMMTTQITDKEVYNDLVTSKRTGFSIEGFLGLKMSEVKMAEPPYHDNCKCKKVGDEIVTEEGVCDYCLEQSFNIDKKNKETKMEKINLPAGEYTSPDGKILVVKEDGTFTIKEVVKEEMGLEVDKTAETGANPGETSEEAKKKETELAEDVVEEEVTEDVKEEEMAEPVEPVQEAVTYTKEEVDAKFDELYKLIADLKAEETIEEVEEVELKKDVKLSVADRFESFVRFARQN